MEGETSKKKKRSKEEKIKSRFPKSVTTGCTFIRERRMGLYDAKAKGHGRVTVRVYKSPQEFLAVANILQDVKHPNICGFLAMNVTSENDLLMIMESCYLDFNEWVEKESAIWEYDVAFRKVISMGIGFLKVFNGIIAGLHALHTKGKFHGNLKSGVTVSKSYEVMLVDISAAQDDVDKGICKDVNDLTDMVQDVVNRHRPETGPKTPPIVDLFYSLGKIFDDLESAQGTFKVSISRLRTFYTFHNPLFADSTKRSVLTKRFMEVYDALRDEMQNTSGFVDDVSIRYWWARLQLGTFCYKTFHYSRDKQLLYIEVPIGVLDFHRDCYVHTETKDGYCEIDAERELNDLLPEFLPQLYYAFVKHFACDRENVDSVLELFRGTHPPIP